MKPVLILQHQTPERPAYLKTWLDQHNIPHKTYNAGAGDEFPNSIEPYAALAVMGGSMSATDPLVSNRQAEILILQAVLKNRPVIGHCLGGQLMSRALGGTIANSPQPEIGWQPIEYTDDPLVKHWFGPTPTPIVIHWHYDSFSLPEGAVRLATSNACPTQAWALGIHLAMQFHIEIDAIKVQDWSNDNDPKWDTAQTQYNSVQGREALLAGTDLYLTQHQATANHIYCTWLSSTTWKIS